MLITTIDSQDIEQLSPEVINAELLRNGLQNSRQLVESIGLSYDWLILNKSKGQFESECQSPELAQLNYQSYLRNKLFAIQRLAVLKRETLRRSNTRASQSSFSKRPPVTPRRYDSAENLRLHQQWIEKQAKRQQRIEKSFELKQQRMMQKQLERKALLRRQIQQKQLQEQLRVQKVERNLKQLELKQNERRKKVINKFQKIQQQVEEKANSYNPPKQSREITKGQSSPMLDLINQKVRLCRQRKQLYISEQSNRINRLLQVVPKRMHRSKQMKQQKIQQIQLNYLKKLQNTQTQKARKIIVRARSEASQASASKIVRQKASSRKPTQQNSLNKLKQRIEAGVRRKHLKNNFVQSTVAQNASLVYLQKQAHNASLEQKWREAAERKQQLHRGNLIRSKQAYQQRLRYLRLKQH